MSFGTSMWNILSAPRLHVRLAGSPPLEASGTDRRNLTRATQQHISATLDALHATPAVVPQAHTTREHENAQTDLPFQSLYCVLLHPALQETTRNSAK
jgi:hypothetical protein